MKFFKRFLLFFVLPIAIVGIVGTAIFAGVQHFLKPDPGIVACENMAKNPGPVSSNNDRMTRQDYLDVRKVFAQSKHKDIREAGTAFIDAAWQLQGNDEITGMLFIQQVTDSYKDLAGACANHNIALPSLSTVK